MCACAKDVVTIGRRETVSYPLHARVAIRHTGTVPEKKRRNDVDQKIVSLLNDLEALGNEIRLSGLDGHAEVVDRAIAELARVHADPKIAEQIITPGRVD